MEKKDNSSSKSELRKYVDKINEITEKGQEKLEEILKDLRLMNSIVEDLVNQGIFGEDGNKKITTETGFSEKVGVFLSQEDRKQCKEILLQDDNEAKEDLRKQLEEKMFTMFSKIVEDLREKTNLPFYIMDNYSIKMLYSKSEEVVWFGDFCFEFTIDIH